MATCAACRETKPESEFSPGLLRLSPGHHVCRPCKNAQTKAYHRANPDKRKMYDATRVERSRQIYAAEQMMRSAVRRGRLIIGPCVVCGTTKGVHGHHFSYEPRHWLSVICLCALHHKRVHAGEIDDSALPVTYGEFPNRLKKGSWPDEVRQLVVAQRTKTGRSVPTPRNPLDENHTEEGRSLAGRPFPRTERTEPLRAMGVDS